MRAWWLAALLWLPVAAHADLWVENCTEANVDCGALDDPYDCCTGAATGDCPIATTTGTIGSTSLGKNDLACWTYDAADGVPSDAESPVFRITANSAVVCFDPDVRDNTTNAGRLTLFHCYAGKVGRAAQPTNTCQSMGELDGTEGDAATQNACIRVGPGAYYAEGNVDCVAGALCRMTVKGEEDVK